ncbi:PWI domain,Zinc finger, CCCH-type,RNA recognition motif domain [Cinara cedri]|uniref:PWI domain,Zinc finger, CCCH-type,RNA recognition motif domain n=1 Tax=Cinara cedri TaxID=506608 RepID=A0A5E4N810_9HEMI|nr:PWI domain,Zinc finger, CCCH-type,RNA recognition motif domain [Cinara cedri]
MQIKDPERFKSWLTTILGPICEAEPAALAKYIFALLKRDRPINELQKFLLSQLEEFLNNETETFTILLVETLRNESYLTEDLGDNKTEIAVTSSGEKSDTGEKFIDKSFKEEEKPRSRSRSLVRSRSPRIKDVKFTRSKRYRRDDHTSDEDEDRESYRKYRYHGRSWSPRRSKSPKFKRRFRSPKNLSRSQSGSPIKKPKEDIFAEFKKSECIEKKTLGRCVDFDEKGYCMKGDLCVYDHGKDPVVLATSGNGVLSFQNAGSSFTNPLTPSFPVVPIVQNVPVPVPIQPYPPAQNQRMYYPSTEGSYWVRGSNGEQKFSKQKRELVNVPTSESQNRFKRKNFKKEDNNNSNNKKPKFDYRRLGPKLSSNEVQLKNVPENLNNISSLNNSFMKFGKITNIQTSSENKEATITFSASHEAQKAYQNIETVFGTLPISANWFTDNSAEVKPVEEKNTTPLQKPKMLSIDNRTTESTRLTNEKEAEVIKSSLIKKQEEAKKLAQDFSAAITKRKQELLDKQLKQLNTLLETAPSVKGQQKEMLMATIIQLKTNIENIQADLASTVKKPITSRSPVKVVKPVPPKTPTKEDKLLESKQEALKNLLLTDLDLFIKQQQGYSDEKEILDLKKNVLALRNKLKSLGITPAAGTAKTAYQMKEKLTIANKLLEAKNKVRETKSTSISVDHRPTQLLVSGYEADDEDQVITHFLQFGNIIEYISDMIIPALVIKYEMRKDAETAQIKGKVFQDRRLSVTWYNSEHDYVDTSNVKAGPCMGVRVLEDQDEDSSNLNDDDKE